MAKILLPLPDPGVQRLLDGPSLELKVGLGLGPIPFS